MKNPVKFVPRSNFCFQSLALLSGLALSNEHAYFCTMLEASEIDKMSLPERLRAIEQLWDAVCRESGDMASPEWHRDIVANRKARAERGEAKFLTLAQLRTRLQGSEP